MISLPDRKYGAIVADPPWRYETWSDKGRDRCPDARPFKGGSARHYEVMSIDDIKALPVADIAAKDCALFLWVTDPMLPIGLEVMAAWGFAYETVAFTWAKHTRTGNGWHIGTGYWTRANPEMCLLGTRGKPKRLDAGVRQLVVAPVREHSRKPAQVHEAVQRLVPGPYIELFARDACPGWDAWGDQVPASLEELLA